MPRRTDDAYNRRRCAFWVDLRHGKLTEDPSPHIDSNKDSLGMTRVISVCGSGCIHIGRRTNLRGK